MSELFRLLIFVIVLFAEGKEMNSLFGIRLGQNISELKVIECNRYQNIKSCRIIPPLKMYNLENFYVVPRGNTVNSIFGQKGFPSAGLCLMNLELIKEKLSKNFGIFFSPLNTEDRVSYAGKTGENLVMISCSVIKVLDFKSYYLTVMLID